VVQALGPDRDIREEQPSPVAQDDAFGGYLKPGDIAQLYHVKVSYVIKLASVHRWGRYKHPDGTTRYRAVHADTTLRQGVDRRRAARSVR